MGRKVNYALTTKAGKGNRKRATPLRETVIAAFAVHGVREVQLQKSPGGTSHKIIDVQRI